MNRNIGRSIVFNKAQSALALRHIRRHALDQWPILDSGFAG